MPNENKPCCPLCMPRVSNPEDRFCIDGNCSCHKVGVSPTSTLSQPKEDSFSAEAVNLAFENGKKKGRKELAEELRALLLIEPNE